MKKVLEVIIAILLVLALILALILVIMFIPAPEQKLKKHLEGKYEKQASAMCTKYAFAKWNYLTDIANNEKKEIFVNVTLEIANFTRFHWKKRFKDVNTDSFKDERLKRQAEHLKIIGDYALDQDKLIKLTSVKEAMLNMYSSARICPFEKQECDLNSEGLTKVETEEIFSKSLNYDELIYAWIAWYNVTGTKIRDLYKTYVDLSNEAAHMNGFKDKGEQWRYAYESPFFSQKIDSLWGQIKPLYFEVHKFVARKLKDKFEDKLNITDGLIPAHVFGTMWTQSWQKIAAIVRPFPSVGKITVTLKSQNYNVLKMFKTADTFYKSMGLIPNDISYNVSAGAMIEKPSDRQVQCTPQAFDFCDGKNYRIKMCTNVIFRDFVAVHHEMGHIQYFLQYAKQPIAFRFGANPGFHEAVGDTIALAVLTPKHLSKINLIKDYKASYESTINQLMDVALQKLAFMPFGLILDKWRWDVFSGAVSEDEWNERWWQYRKKYQRVKPPVERSITDFDPAAIFHITADYSYISYFVAHVLQFQFYKSLCTEAGEYNPDDKKSELFNCDFSGSEKAGEKFSDGLKLGSSKHWKQVLNIMTGQEDLDANALLQYFAPLHDYLTKENNK